MTKSAGGKGSNPRPFTVPREQYESSWDAIFRKQPPDSNPTQQEQTSNNKESDQTALT